MTQTQHSQHVRKVRHYPASPHGPIEQLFDGIWFVQGGVKMPMFLPVKIGRAMTIVRDPEGGLALFNSMRLSEQGLRELDALGPVKHIIRIGGFHGRDDAFYRDRYNAKVYALEGQRYIRGMSFDVGPEKEYMKADVYLNERSPLPIADAQLQIFTTSTPPEANVILKREGGIIISGDSLQNTPKPDKYFNFMAKIMMKKFGFFKPYNVGPGWLQFASPSQEDVRSVMDLEFEHVLPGHGMPVLHDAKNKFSPSICGELKGCHPAE